MNRTTLLIIGALIVLLAIGYFTGPRIEIPHYPETLPEVPGRLEALANYVERREANYPTRADNEARILFADSVPGQTEYAFVYLHGFAGSHRDGYPVNVNVPQIFGSNVYLARWAGHGLIGTAALENFSPAAAWEDAREALAIGKQLGRKVILMSTSTGGTLALKLAADFPDDVHALINMGPNLADDQPGARLLMTPWGHELAKLVSFGSNKKIEHPEPRAPRYFDTIYPSEALVQLQILVQTTMDDTTFSQITCPALTVYYHKNEFAEDEHVELDAYPGAHAAFATPAEKKRLVALPTPGTHFVGSAIKSEDWLAAQRAIVEFCTEVLGMNPLLPVDHRTNAAPLQ
jgi:pimeloyl-ACP methyl ester carboxylesterase